MKFLLSLFTEISFFIYPSETIGWLVWFAFLVAILWFLWTVRKYNTPRKKILRELLLAFLVATPLAGFLLALRLPAGAPQALPGFPIMPASGIILIFSALPWMLAGGYFGPLPGAFLATLMGVILGSYGNHSLFTPIIYGFLGAIFSLSLRQRFRTTAFRLLRRPIIAGFLLSLIYAVLFLLTSLFIINGSLPVRLDYVISHLGGDSLAFSIQVLLGGAILEAISIGYPKTRFGEEDLEPSPTESSLEARLFFLMAPMVLILILILMAGDWIIAGKVSRDMIENQMRLTADTAAESIPLVQITGQSLLAQASKDERLLEELEGESFAPVLQEIIRETPFFDQLSLVDANQQSIAGYPENDFENILPSQLERMGIGLALDGIIFQYYTLAPVQSGSSARLSFIVPLSNTEGNINRILIGRTSLDTNPYFVSVQNNLNEMTKLGGHSILLDSQNQILFHTQPERIGQEYLGDIWGEENFFYGTNSNGNRVLEYFKPVDGQSWSVVTSLPAQVAQQAAMDIAIPLLGLLIALILLAYVLLRYSIGSVSRSLQSLVAESTRISEGDLGHSLALKGSDELGNLSQSFEKMRRSLKARLDETNRLLAVSKGAASSLDFDTLVPPILEGALATGASSVRLIFTDGTQFKTNEGNLKRYGSGIKSDAYEDIDEHILELSKKQEKIILKDLSRSDIIHPLGLPLPASLMALALMVDEVFYGTLWVGYHSLHKFGNEEIEYLENVASQAATAAANVSLYTSAIGGRNQIEAIINSSTDPVFVTDNNDKFVLLNPAALELLAVDNKKVLGKSIKKVKAPKILLNLLSTKENEISSSELKFENGRVYNANASTIIFNNHKIGRICILSDVSSFKNSQKLTAEYISTVSHDLRSPLTFILGYASMLEMVGDLNEEQIEYVKKIIYGVESMSDMVTNMLEVERIEEDHGLILEKVSVMDIAKQVVEEMQILALQKQIKLSIETPEANIPEINADKTLLHQALQNLIENGIKYTESGGTVQVSIELKEESILITVKDSGIGIAPIDQQKVFDRFYRVVGFDNNKEKGSGLGLTIVKSIAEKHGGTITVESQLGIGSSFYLSIPINN